MNGAIVDEDQALVTFLAPDKTVRSIDRSSGNIFKHLGCVAEQGPNCRLVRGRYHKKLVVFVQTLVDIPEYGYLSIDSLESENK